ncbi:MAG: hypothetical protein LBC72_02025 [Spirochaetaceae bacterium]|jgi:hypothetical protein|nr:hypothetical protein [Spirochaetaceae bacterium]
MIATGQPEKRKKVIDPQKIAALKEKINNEAYLQSAIFRLAQVVSNEYVGIGQRGLYDERKWEGRR